MEWFTEHPGGLNRYLAHLKAALEEAGLVVPTVIVGPVPEGPVSIQSAGGAEAPLPLRLLRYWRAAQCLARDIDVVDAHFALYAFLPLRLGRLRSVPLVVHFQGPWTDESVSVGKGGPLTAVLKRQVERSVYRRAAEIVVLTGAFRQILVERYRIPPWTVRVLAPGVDLSAFTPGRRSQARTVLGVEHRGFVAVTVRRLIPRMGLEVLLEAWAQFTQDKTRGLLLIVGDGPIRTGLSARADELGIRDNVRFLGRVDDQRLHDCYRAADVSIVPSVALEGYGLVVLESLACGVPTMVSDVGGLPEAVGSLDRSLIVPGGDAGALARRLESAFDGTVPLPGPEDCRRHALGFSWSKVADANLHVYRGAAKPRPSQKMRVVYLDHSASLSGGELALVRLLAALKDVEAHVILAEDGPLVHRLLETGVSVEVLALGTGTRSLRRSEVRPGAQSAGAALVAAGYALRLSLRLRDLRPQLVHTNSLKAGVYGTAAARMARIPAVWHVRDRISEEYLPGPAVMIVRRLMESGAHAIIANSATTLATLRLSPGQGTVIPSSLGAIGSARDGTGPEGRARPQVAHPVVVGIVGRIAPWKGQDVALRAFSRAFPNGGERLVVVGAPLFGQDEVSYDASLRTLARGLGIADRVEFRGFQEDVAGELGQIDILVHASTIPEPFGQVVVEGMAAGRPVVAADAGGPAEVITDGVDGVLYRGGDIDGLSRALQRLAADPSLRSRLGAAAKRRSGDFSSERASAKVMDVYRQVLGSGVRS